MKIAARFQPVQFPRTRIEAPRKALRASLAAAGLAVLYSFTGCAFGQQSDDSSGDRHGDGGRHVKVMIVTMFGPEGQIWLDKLGPWQTVSVPGLSPDYPDVHCNRDDVCVITTGMGHANAAASIMALTFSDRLDLRHTYFLIAGIAGIDPARGTLGSAAWAKYLVDFGIQWEIDAREKPADWPTGFLGINTKARTTNRRSTIARRFSR